MAVKKRTTKKTSKGKRYGAGTTERTHKSKVIYAKKKQTGGSNKMYDVLIKAMPPGKRQVKGSKPYYEYRKNRTDRPNSLSGYFKLENINSLDDLKKLYWKLSKKLHPDTPSGSEAAFKEMSNEYEELVNSYLKFGGFTKKEATQEIQIDEAFFEVIQAAMKIPTIEVEIVGSWIWVSGMTFPVRAELKKLGFQFAPIKKMWYINTTGMKTKKGKELPIEQIRNKYSSRKLKRNDKGFFLEGIETNLSTREKNKFKLALAKLIRKMKLKK